MTQTAKEVLATIGYPGFVRSLYNRTGDLSKDFTHAVLGLVTESHEYLEAVERNDVVEEAGDLAFYSEALQQVLNDLSPINEAELDKFEDEIMASYAGTIVDLEEIRVEWLDLAKRWIGYGKAPTISTTRLLAEARAMINFTIQAGKLTQSDAMQVLLVNIEKLMTRYNGIKFSADLAVNRDVATERKVIDETVG